MSDSKQELLTLLGAISKARTHWLEVTQQEADQIRSHSNRVSREFAFNRAMEGTKSQAAFMQLQNLYGILGDNCSRFAEALIEKV